MYPVLTDDSPSCSFSAAEMVRSPCDLRACVSDRLVESGLSFPTVEFLARTKEMNVVRAWDILNVGCVFSFYFYLGGVFGGLVAVSELRRAFAAMS